MPLPLPRNKQGLISRLVAGGHGSRLSTDDYACPTPTVNTELFGLPACAPDVWAE
ncbi:hypothetical protein DAI22_02g227750 [Oryza sativa Japonica Group]|nr:hypothetical protein DAI22_02g227750 [Oryza sativa Japonica Group]